ncbi:MAG: histidine kinase [Flavobacteriales bacterium]|nr:histidine kinase [Flavobacteriales bacterium]
MALSRQLLIGLLFLLGTACQQSGSDPSQGKEVPSSSAEGLLAMGDVLEAARQQERDGDPKKAIDLLQEALKDSTSLGQTGRSHGLQELVRLYESIGETDRTIETAQQFLDLGPEPLPVERAEVSVRLSNALFRLRDPRAFDPARDAFTYYQEQGDLSRKARQALDLLVSSFLLTNELSACRALLDAELELAQAEGDRPWYAYIADRRAAVLNAEGKVEEALEQRMDALRSLTSMRVDGHYRDTTIVRRPPASDGNGESKEDEEAKVRQYRLLIPEQERAEQELLIHIGKDLAALGRPGAALEFLDRAQKLAELLQDVGLPPPHVERAEVLLTMGRQREALDAAQKGMDIAREQHDHEQALAASQVLYRTHRALGHEGAALRMLEQVRAYEDSLDQEDLRIALAKQQVQYQRKQEASLFEAESARLAAEKELAQIESRNRGRIAIAAGAGGLLLVAGLGAWFFTDRKRRKERFEKEAATLETQALRSQMNPHFIFNALNSINAFVQRNEPDNATSFLTKFARVMRSVLENSRHSEVALEDDLNTLKGYMELERKRMEEKFDFTIEVHPDIDPEEVLVPPLVVQPFVENAIWHGMSQKEGKGHITLRVKPEGGQLIWHIEDDGVGRNAKKEPAPAPTPGQPVKKTSLGTAITRSRLDLVQKQHGGKAGFHYEDLPQGTRVVVEMPMLLS